MYPRKRALERIAREKVLYERSPGGDISVCVIYPNVYRLGMANLGFQAVFHIFETDPSVAADRAFLPDVDERASFRSGGERLVSFERGRPLSDFDILAFSISFETDYLNVLSVLKMAGIPARRAARVGRNFPLVIAGGSAVFPAHSSWKSASGKSARSERAAGYESSWTSPAGQSADALRSIGDSHREGG